MKLTLFQKIAIAVTLPVTGLLLYFLFKEPDDEEDDEMVRNITTRQSVVTVKVPKDAVGAVIGAQGANIKKIQEESGARVNFNDRKESEDESQPREVIIRGTQESTSRAEMAIRKIIAETPPIVEEELYVQQKYLGRLIGRGGETIRQISRTSKAKINIERSDDNNRRDKEALKKISIKGTQIAIDLAKSMLEEKIQEEDIFQKKLVINATNRQQRTRSDGPPHHKHKQEAATPEVTVNGAVNGAAEGQEISTDPSPKSRLIPAAPMASDEIWEVEEPSLNDMMEDWPTETGFMEVYISAVEHPGHFWVQLINSQSTQLDRLTQDMTRYYTYTAPSLQAGSNEGYKVGDIVAAPFQEDELWYRARVEEVTEDGQLDLYYVDFGDSKILSPTFVHKIRSDFLSLKFQAFECSLANVRPVGGEWSEDAIIEFENIIHVAKWKPVQARTVCFQEVGGMTQPAVQLVDTNGPQDIDTAEALISMGFAEFHETASEETSRSLGYNSKLQVAS